MTWELGPLQEGVEDLSQTVAISPLPPILGCVRTKFVIWNLKTATDVCFGVTLNTRYPAQSQAHTTITMVKCLGAQDIISLQSLCTEDRLSIWCETRLYVEINTLMSQESQAEHVWNSCSIPAPPQHPLLWGTHRSMPQIAALTHSCSFSTDGVKHYRLYFTLEV